MARGRLGSTYVPGEDDEDGPHGHLADEALEALFWLARGVPKGVLADLDEVLGSLDGGGDLFCRVGDGAPHLHGQLDGELILLLVEDSEGLLDNVLALVQRGLAPRLECRRGDVWEQLEVRGRDAVAREDGLVGCRRDGGDDFDRHDGSS